MRSRRVGEAAIACPTCRRPMEQVAVEHAAVDWCREHGAWFDFGELQQVLSTIARGGRNSEDG